MKRLFTCFLILLSLGLTAQNADVRNYMRTHEPTRNVTDVPADSVRFWVGEGTNEVVAAFFFCGTPSGGVAYGYRFNNSTTYQAMFDAIAAADPNFSYTASGSFINSITYNNGTLNYALSGGMCMYTLNDAWPSSLSDVITTSGYFELLEFTYGGDCNIPNANVFYPEDPNAQTVTDASIDADDILYWVGGGEHSVVFATNWCDTAIAFAWGVRFSGDSITVKDVMHTIALYDSRFSFTPGSWGLGDILFQDGTYNLSLQGSWWMFNVNGTTAPLGYDAQKVVDGDIIKFGDESCGIADENYNYTWTTPIQPVALPAPSTEVFDGIVGTDGCQAIAYNDVNILGWATNCTIERGPRDIASNPTPAAYGTESAGIGASSNSTLDAVSLGDGGKAILTFGMPISDGEGYDFAVFENSLNHTFLELAFVEVSSDGEHFYRFPSVSNSALTTQVNNGGSVDATKLNNLAGKYMVGWGTPFDLAELEGYSNLDIHNITHVRLVDAIGSINPLYGTTDKNGHLINDPYPTNFESSGFDLTGVAIMNGWAPTGVNDFGETTQFTVYPNPCTDFVVISNIRNNEPVILHNILGEQIEVLESNDYNCRVNMQRYPAGIYFIQVGNTTQKIIKR
ncbi:MAG: T9SS type A sorting domain-containing protein [Bacteroidales bacterium]|nr:T9SS type A sorting domain-containing protein [Bacteroidales bacterium]